MQSAPSPIARRTCTYAGTPSPYILSSFLYIITRHMQTKPRQRPRATNTSISRATTGRRLITAADIDAPSPAAASRALSRLASAGKLVRAAKGIYYAPIQTALGPTPPPKAELLQAKFQGRYRPIKSTAANLLGLSTQIAARPEIVLYATAIPSPVPEARIRLRRGSQLHPLTESEGAFLEVLRDRATHAQTNPRQTLERLIDLLRSEPNGFRTTNVCRAALAEPPRVRAILGAMLQEAGLHPRFQSKLRSSLNPLSQFHFGVFANLSTATQWQAK